MCEAIVARGALPGDFRRLKGRAATGWRHACQGTSHSRGGSPGQGLPRFGLVVLCTVVAGGGPVARRSGGLVPALLDNGRMRLGSLVLLVFVGVVACHAGGAETQGDAGAGPGGSGGTGGQHATGGRVDVGGTGGGGGGVTAGGAGGGTASGGAQPATGGQASGGASGTGGVVVSACVLAHGTCLTSCAVTCGAGESMLPMPSGCPITESNAVCGGRCCVPAAHGGNGGGGGQGGAGGVRGHGEGGDAARCGTRACANDEFCCGPPACGHCAKLLTEPNCPATCP